MAFGNQARTVTSPAPAPSKRRLGMGDITNAATLTAGTATRSDQMAMGSPRPNAHEPAAAVTAVSQ
jgi:hypothetical protein